MTVATFTPTRSITSDFITAHPASAILLDCGCGKTIITLTAIADLLWDLFDVNKVLVICPIRVAQVWAEEIGKWSHLQGLRYSIAVGAESQRRYALAQDADIYVIRDHPEMTGAEVQSHLADFTIAQVRGYRNKLGYYDRKIIWTPEMDRHILDNMNWPAHKLKKEFFPEMSATSVHNRKKELGWRAPEKEIWPDDKIQRFSELYVHGGTKWVQEHPEFLGMTSYQVQKKAEKFHLKRDGRPVNLNWSLEETLILEEELRKPNGQRRSYEEISDLMPRHSALAVKRRMKRMMDKKDTWLN